MPGSCCEGGLYVLVDFISCKGEAISWYCCRFGSCIPTDCGAGGSLDTSKFKCDEVTTSIVQTAIGATTVSLQVHDGRITGNYDCSAPGASCCGGAGGACAVISGVCDDVIVPITGLDT
ncbi:hypothetical protein CHLRE_03g150767v5 [Chlamydomonas reinhardtii]|uniref:Uncharacterized protein n=1 Tax=Chlamydomonas reinhardtii TaxID=3055 RepID=A0A2K3DVN5_CHLRE|nr:uncharacterized protein CHLRE_03g150767v5 [Chlamydomonas reinhardtii]PNW84600.1 hypothetical protein CHLRE_03g150767v5 [Chlamydomonas reinhardtii]